MSIPNESLLVKISGDVSNLKASLALADKEIKKLKKEAGDAEAKVSDLGKVGSNIMGMFAGKAKDTGLGSFIGDLGEGTTALSAFAGPASIAAGAIVGIGTAAVATGAGLFALAKEASDYGSEIADAQAKTGLAADSLSALRYQANLSGSDFGQVSGAISKFSKLVGEAGSGSKEAAAKLKALGIDPQEALRDLDGAMGKAFKTINDAKPGVNQMTAAQTAFGKSGADLIPTIRGMGGDFAALKKRATELGIVLSEEDVQAADAFGDTLDTLTMQAKAASSKFALQFAPEITGAMDEISKYLSKNKDDWKEWGKSVADTFRGVALAAKSDAGQTTKEWIESYLKFTNSVPLWFYSKIQGGLQSAGAETRAQEYNGTTLDMETAMPGVTGYGAWKGYASPSAKNAEGEDFAKTLGSATAKTKKEKTEAQKTTWNSGTLAEFARNQGFKPGDGFAKTGHNEGSLHGLNRALDIGLNASNQGKTINQIVQMMENSIKAGIRVVDERVRPKGQKKWSAAHVHLEENDKRASSFNPNLDYGGRLEYLKALDKERLSGKGQSLADALGTVKKDEISEGQKAIADLNKQIALLGVTTEEGRAKIETTTGSLAKSTEEEKKNYIALAAKKDSIEAQSKATADYNDYLIKLNEQYDEMNGVEKTATGELEKYIDALIASGKAVDPVSEANARNKTLMMDMQGVSVKLADASAEMTDRYKAERDAAWELVVAHQELKNAIARETGGREETAGGIQTGVAAPTDDGKAPPEFRKKQGDFTDGLLGGNGNNLGRFTTEADAMKAVYNDLQNTAGAALGSMIEGGAQLLEQWIMTGEISGQAVAQMTASIIAGVASQAAVKAIFEVAEGFASSAIGDVRGAAMHFAAAKTYGMVALGAAAIGAGVGLAGGLGGKKDKNGSSNSTQNPSEYFQNDKDDRNMNYLRQSQGANVQSQQRENVQQLSAISDAVNGLTNKINSMRPGDVLTNGIKQNPGMISDTMDRELAKNSTKATNFGRRILRS